MVPIEASRKFVKEAGSKVTLVEVHRGNHNCEGFLDAAGIEQFAGCCGWLESRVGT